MLFGATIKREGRFHRIELSRQKDRWPALTWAIIVAKAQDRTLDFFNFKIDCPKPDVLRFSSRTSRFLSGAYRRWYSPDGTRQFPDGLQTEHSLLFWLMGNWKHQGNLTLPCTGARSGQMPLISHTLQPPEDWQVFTNPQKKHLSIAGKHRPRVVEWLKGRVPQELYS